MSTNMNSGMTSGNFNLNAVFLKNRMIELGLKQWWLAEQIGVDRKTVSRWLQGHVRNIQPENAQLLAKILEAPLSSILLGEPNSQLATSHQQKQAAELLLQSSLLEKLGPIGEWDVIESLLKAVLLPDLPLHILAELYEQLSIASWRQSKISEASQFNAKAEELAKEICDHELYARTLRSKANILSWRGQTQQAIDTYRECLSFSKYLDDREVGATHSNLGAVLYEIGLREAGRAELDLAMQSFEKKGSPVNFSIVWIHYTILALQDSNISEASRCCFQAMACAKAGESKRGLALSKLLQAEIESLSSHQEEALMNLREALQEFDHLKIADPLNYEIAGRISKNLGDLEQSEKYLREGLQCGKNFPVYLAAVHAELAQVLALMGHRNADADIEFKNAEKLYNQCGAPLKVIELKQKFLAK